MTVQLRPWQPPRRRKPRKRMQGSAAERGYNYAHQKLRAQYKPVVDAGMGWCHAAVCLVERDGGSRHITPGTPWHLGHTADRSAWTGPEHARCNLSDGAVRGNRMRATANGMRKTGMMTARQSRAW